MKSKDTDINNPQVICEQFLERHSLSMSSIGEQEILAIFWTIRIRIEIDQGLDTKIGEFVERNEPTWGLLRSMLDRTFEHAEASIVCYLTGSPASSEVVSRTTVESALNIMYILNGDRVSRLYQYFSHYFETEEKELDRWVALISPMNESYADTHRYAIENKRGALMFLREFVDRANLEVGLNVTENKKWPNIADRFKILGLELDHRTLYASMCSQTHNDAEDLLNYFVVVSLGDKSLLNKAAVETINFSRLLVYSGIRYYIKAAMAYAECFGLTNAAIRLEYGHRTISKLLEGIALNAQ